MATARRPPVGGEAGRSRGSAPLHERIRRDLEGRILSGQWPPGHRLPVEHDLAVRYGCARMTVRRALGELARRGLIERRRRTGTFVAWPHVASAVLAIPDLPAEVAARGEVYAYRLLSRAHRRAAAEDVASLDVPRGTLIIALRCLHLAGNRPFALEERLLNGRAVPDARTAPFEQVPPGTWLLDHAPWTQAENRIAAVGADAALSRVLRVRRGTACLQVDRRTWRAGQAITTVRQTFPGDRYHLLARFTPEAS